MLRNRTLMQRCFKHVQQSRFISTCLRKVLHDEEQTRSFGAKIANLCKKGDVIALVGDMGSGKTIFSQGFIRALARNPRLHVTSPTYLLDNMYISHDNIKLKGGRQDLARLDLFQPEDIYVIEWGDKLFEMKPSAKFLEIFFDYSFEEENESQKNIRHVTLKTEDTDWMERLNKLGNTLVG